MRVPVLVMLTMATILTAAPSRAQNSPDYPFCMRVYTLDGDHVECDFASLQQCARSASGRQASCFANPNARAAAPAPTAPNVPPQPAAKPKR